MSILLKWKNKLQDPSLYETKIREFDERVSHLKNENVELHKRIDQLEALCTTSVDTPQKRSLEEHIRQLEQENGRLFAENQCQRQEYERFLDQLTTMVLRTAVMQDNIRKECASIYHVIERISTLTPITDQDEHSHQTGHRTKRLKSLSWGNLNQPIEFISNYQLLSNSPKTTTEFIRHLYRNRSSLSSSTSSSSCSSATTHCSFSTSGSWTLDLALYNKNTKNQLPILPISNESSESQAVQKEEESQQIIQRSETFVVAKIPQEELSSPPPPPSSDIKTMTANERNLNSNVQRCSTTRAMASTTTTPTVVRPSRLPSRCSNNRTTSLNNSSNSKSLPSNNNNNNNNNNNRSLSVRKASKVPIRTTTSLTKPITPVKKSNVPTPVAIKTKKDSTVTSNRAVTSVNNSTTKKTIRPPSISKPAVVQNSSSKFRSRSITTVNNNTTTTTNTSTPSSSINKRTRTTPPVVKKTAIEPIVPVRKLAKPVEEKSSCPIEKMNSTSSESSIEENQQTNKLLTVVQDEGYSTWSSSDVKDDIKSNNLKKNGTDEQRRRNTGLVKNWLDTSNKRFSRKPVKEVEIDKLEEFSRELSDGTSIICPFVRNRCSNGIIIPLASTTLSTTLQPPLPQILPDKDISLDSLDGADSPQPKEQTITSSSSTSSPSSSSSSSVTFSRSETFEKVLIRTSLPNISDDLADSTDSTCSDINQLFHISEYIEDNFIDQDDNCTEHYPTIINKIRTNIKPQKRLMFPGLLNRLILLRRFLSDSDLRQKVCCIEENEMQFHVYHSNTINEHSIELNLMNTYGSESELHVWSHDCAEQRRFIDERQQQQQQQLLITSNQSQTKLSHIERMIRMTLDDNEEDETNLFELDNEEYDQQLALERQTLLQQIYEYPWLLQDDDLDQTTVFSSPNSEQPLLSPSPDLIVPSHNPDFYQLCALTNSSSFATSYGTNSRHTTPPIASSVL